MELFPHQKKVLKDTKDHNRVLYALDMGLGKTFVSSHKAVEELRSTEILVVCQKSMISTWRKHFETWHPEFEVYDLTDKKQFDSFQIATGKSVAIINYDLVWRRDQVVKRHWETVILDESSLLQNEQAKRTKAVLKMPMDNVILLSGTVVNGKYEKLWSQFRLLGWKISKKDFYKRYVIERDWDAGVGFPIKIVVGYRRVNELKEQLRDYGAVFMRTSEAGVELPEQIFTTINVKMSSEYRKFAKNKIIEIDGEKLVGDTLLSERLYKRMLCGAYSKEKLDAFKDLLDSTDDRLIVFYNFDEELRRLLTITGDRPISVVNGKVRDLKNYEEHENSVTFVQYQAGSMGLNLQKANKIVYFTLPDGQAENFQQSQKRTHRIGQQRTCWYYILEVEGSIEQEITKALIEKSGRIERLFD